MRIVSFRIETQLGKGIDISIPLMEGIAHIGNSSARGTARDKRLKAHLIHEHVTKWTAGHCGLAMRHIGRLQTRPQEEAEFVAVGGDSLDDEFE